MSDWFLAEASRVYDDILRDNNTAEFDDLAHWIRARGGKITAAQLHQAKRSRFPKSKDAQEMLDRLVETGRGTWEKEGSSKRGRPTVRFCVA